MVLLCVDCSECQSDGDYVECCFVKCRMTKCHLAKCHSVKCRMTKCRLTKCQLVECCLVKCLVKCRLTKCRLVKCRSVVQTFVTAGEKPHHQPAESAARAFFSLLAKLDPLSKWLFMGCLAEGASLLLLCRCRHG